MKILFATTHDPDDRMAYSGTTYHMRKALVRQGVDVEVTGAIATNRKYISGLKKVLWKSVGREFEVFRDPLVYNHIGSVLELMYKRTNADFVFSPGSHVVAGVRNVPFSCWPDATFACWSSITGPAIPFCSSAIRNGYELDRNVSKHSLGVAYSSAWAMNSAIHDFGMPLDAVVAIPYGANLEYSPAPEDVEEFIYDRASTLTNSVRFLFVGKDLMRKGMPFACRVVEALNKRGYSSSIHIVGASPADVSACFDGVIPRGVICEGFLDPNSSIDRDKLLFLYRKSHFFILPTIADFTPMVLSEAMSYAIPCLVNRVGGISSQLADDSSLMFDVDSSVEEWCVNLMGYLGNVDRYVSLSRAAYIRYGGVLNWDSAVRSYIQFMERRIAHARFSG